MLDFYCPKAHLAIEIDGISHDMGNRPQHDEQRDAWLKKHGVTVMRIPAAELNRNIDEAADAIVRTRHGDTLSPAPPPPPLRGGPPPPLSRGRMNRPPPRLYLVTPALDDTASFARDLDAVLTTADIAAVLLRLADADERALINRAKTVAAAVQRRDIALLLDGRAEIVGRVGADGAHLTGIEAFTAALPSLKPDRIAGAGGLRSRHDAMLAGESGADYVMFGEPDRRGNRPQWGAVEDRVKWWADLVEVPCIGYAGEAGEVRLLAQAGADFVALGDWIWTHPQGAAAAVTTAASALAEPVP